MKLSPEEVQKIAHLARLELSDTEVETFSNQLSSILTYIEKLDELDTKGIEPTAHAVEVATPFRKDEVKQEIAKEDALKNAPDREGDYFKVPKVI
jgi:aspartyl-tRNA(Asn)/glutamyl-tRNA(Gln) amidotransferase subunit C